MPMQRDTGLEQKQAAAAQKEDRRVHVADEAHSHPQMARTTRLRIREWAATIRGSDARVAARTGRNF